MKPLRLLGWGAVALTLLAPAVAMRFTDEVNWTPSDFGLAAILLISGGAMIELVAWRARTAALRIGLALLVLAVVALVWAEGAVGIFR
jgi:hypothetical protein